MLREVRPQDLDNFCDFVQPFLPCCLPQSLRKLAGSIEEDEVFDYVRTNLRRAVYLLISGIVPVFVLLLVLKPEVKAGQYPLHSRTTLLKGAVDNAVIVLILSFASDYNVVPDWKSPLVYNCEDLFSKHLVGVRVEAVLGDCFGERLCGGERTIVLSQLFFGKEALNDQSHLFNTYSAYQPILILLVNPVLSLQQATSLLTSRINQMRFACSLINWLCFELLFPTNKQSPKSPRGITWLRLWSIVTGQLFVACHRAAL